MPGMPAIPPDSLKQLKEKIKNVFRRKKQLNGNNLDETVAEVQPSGANAPGSEGATANPAGAAQTSESQSALTGNPAEPRRSLSLPNESAVITDSDSEADIPIQKPKPAAAGPPRLPPGQPEPRAQGIAPLAFPS